MKKRLLVILFMLCTVTSGVHAENVDGIGGGAIIGGAVGMLAGGFIAMQSPVPIVTIPYSGGNIIGYAMVSTIAQGVVGGLEGMLAGALLGGVIGYFVCPANEAVVSANVQRAN